MAIRSLLPEAWSGERSVWNPIREMNRLQRRIDRLFDEVFAGGSMPSSLFRGEREFVPACDVAETDKHYLLTLDLPGVKKDEVSISLRDHELTVSGERKSEHEEKAGGQLTRERQYGSFFRSFTIPGEVKLDCTPSVGGISRQYHDRLKT